MTISDRLNEMIHGGVLQVVIQADSAWSLLKEIGERAKTLNDAGFGAFFGLVQNSQVDRYVLALTKLFEIEKRNPSQSLFAIRDFLANNAPQMTLADHPFAIQEINRASIPISSKPCDQDLIQALVAIMDSRLPRKRAGEPGRLHGILDALKARRDKVIAHNERVTIASLPTATWKEGGDLLDTAKDLVHLVGRACLNLHCKNEDEYILERDAHKPTVCLRRLLKAAGL